MSDEGQGPYCPIETGDGGVIELAHGGGGRMMRRLIEEVIAPAFSEFGLDAHRDCGPFKIDGPAAFTTDSYVVKPLFFPGGDIGELSVYGTINDLAMGGAAAEALTISFIIEEGLPLRDLRLIVNSIAAAARRTGVRILAGDTKVVERGKGDGIYINSAGIGARRTPYDPAPEKICSGDAVILSGDIGRHGVAVMAARTGLEFAEPIASDCAPLWPEVAALLAADVELRCLRDLTRGGLASALVEIAEASASNLLVEEAAIPVSGPVRAACELLGLDAIHVANEGRFIVFTPQEQADAALAALRSLPGGAPRQIGRVERRGDGVVILENPYGVARRLHLPKGEQLPRIC